MKAITAMAAIRIWLGSQDGIWGEYVEKDMARSLESLSCENAVCMEKDKCAHMCAVLCVRVRVQLMHVTQKEFTSMYGIYGILYVVSLVLP